MTEQQRIFFKKLKRVLKIIVTIIWIIVSVLALLIGAAFGVDGFFQVFVIIVIPTGMVCLFINYLLSENKRDILQQVHFLLDRELTGVINISASGYSEVLSSGKVKAVLQKYHVVFLEEDITKYHDELMKFIRSHGRNSIPFTIVYGPNAKDGIVLDEIPSAEDVVTAIEKAASSI